MELVDSFIGHTNEGDEVRFLVYQIFTISRSRRGDLRIPGRRCLKTSGGEDVNRLEKGRYQILQSGIEVTSSDPNAM